MGEGRLHLGVGVLDIQIRDISKLFKNIDIDKIIFENINIDIDKELSKNINIDRGS